MYLASRSISYKIFQLQKIIDIVVSMINFIKFKALIRIFFDSFLKEVGDQYTDLITFNSIKWLLGGLLKRFFQCLKEVITFLSFKNYNTKYLHFLTNPNSKVLFKSSKY